MVILFAMEVAALIVLFYFSRGRFIKEMSTLDGKGDRLRRLIPSGLLLLGLLSHNCSSAYEKNLEMKLRCLVSSGKAHLALKLHLARKVILMYILLIFITFVGTQTGFDLVYVLFSISLLCGVFILSDRQLDDRLKERLRNMQLEFPEFLNKLILLVNAGLTVRGGIQKIVRDNKKDNPLYTELVMTVNDISTGKNEMGAYEDFARRCRLQEVTMFTAALMQNLRKGSDEVCTGIKASGGYLLGEPQKYCTEAGRGGVYQVDFPYDYRVYCNINYGYDPGGYANTNMNFGGIDMFGAVGRFIKEEDGLGTVEIVILIAVLVGLALIFRKQIYALVNQIFDRIFGNVGNTTGTPESVYTTEKTIK